MSEYRWNSGSTFNGKQWEDHLPTDAAIVMHLMATYLDTQLVPLPHQPDARKFVVDNGYVVNL
ncbi:transmembrane protein 209-like [Chrysoperla carnea]|nr:transmembrane protein 209-like [Chrysoperla carnea]